MKTPRNVPASVRQRLLNVARERGEDFQGVLTRYALERLLFRLSASPHGQEFVLKGAMLFAIWTGQPHRTTRDLDLLGRGSVDIRRLEDVFRSVCKTAVEPDGLELDQRSVTGSRIREDQEYEGVRVEIAGRIGVARVHLQIDVGFGDVITPRPREIAYPTLLDYPAPRLKAYPRETVVAEKFHAMVHLGMANSRMKDFYDVWTLARNFDFDGALLAKAIAATFERRRTQVPSDEPLALTGTFARDSVKQTQWSAFLRKSALQATLELPSAVSLLHGFLMPPTRALTHGDPFTTTWSGGGPWA
jgi:predicted nucleotidyltransferase component of viral defense system